MSDKTYANRDDILSLITCHSSLFFRRAPREPQAKAAARAGLRLGCERAAHRLGEGERDGESETGAAPRVFRREERVEDARERFGRDAGACVFDLDADALAVEHRQDAD